MVDGYCTLGVDREYELSADDLLRQLDTVGVEQAVIGPTPRQMAVFNGEGNQAILAAAEQHERLIPTCTVNPWYGAEALDELNLCAGKGAKLLVLDPSVQGFAAADELVFPVIEAALEYRLPIYLHTGGYQYGSPGQVGLLAERYPEATLIMGHCGSTDFKAEAIEVARLYPTIYSETSLTRPFGAVATLEALGDERVIMGSAAPLNDLMYEWRETLTALPADRWPGYYGRTLERLLTHDH